MLQMVSVSKRLGEFRLSEISLDLREGEYFVLVGPSGVGKTVLLEIVAGLLQPDSGSILWRKKEIARRPPERRGFALVYQQYALFPHMTVLENVCYGLRAKGVSSKKAVARAKEMTEALSIGNLHGRDPKTLSGGEKQRVALARALVTEPEMLLLDEPLAALDPGERMRLRRLLKTIQSERGTVFLHVTHDVDEALYLGHRVGVLLDGRLQQVGTPEEVFRQPSDKKVAGFIGLKNVLTPDQVDHEACVVHGVKIHVTALESSTSHIWIRPEEILLSRLPFQSSARNQFRCVATSWEHTGPLMAVHVRIGDLILTALITYASFTDLEIKAGTELFCTFKSSAIHCF